MLDAFRIGSLFNSESTTSQDAIGSLFNFRREEESPAEQFASWLPYSAYIAEEKVFINRDNLGFMLELMPQSGADERMVEVPEMLYGRDLGSNYQAQGLKLSKHFK